MSPLAQWIPACAGMTAFFICIAHLPALAAEIRPGITLDTDLRFQAYAEDNAALGADASGSGSSELRLRLKADLTDKALFFWEGRGVGTAGGGDFETGSTGALSDGDGFLEMKQAFVQAGRMDGGAFHARAGRQRLREDAGLWWNDDLDALRFGYTSTVFSGFIAAGQDFASYNTSTGALSDNARNLARLLAEGSWQYRYDHFIETRVMALNDHSGVTPAGSYESTFDRNSADGNLLWFGARAKGKLHSPLFKDTGKISYRLDIMNMGGRERTITTASGGPGITNVTGARNETVHGWAFDAALDIPLPVTTHPLLHLGYAYGSPDFRQTGLDGNTSRIGALSQTTHHYGTVLRPDLSNIHIASLGITAPVFESADAGLIYRHYRLAETAASLPSSGITNALNGNDKNLGQGIDFLFNFDILKRSRGLDSAKFRGSVGAFRTGKAYGDFSGETVWRGIAEIQLGF